MKYFLYCCLLVTGLSIVSACSNGDYVANPSSNVNGGVNPLKPLTASQFTWTGTNPMSASINGSPWIASSYTYSFDSGNNMITGINGSQIIQLNLKNAYAGNLYSMGYQMYNTSGFFTDSLGDVNNTYYSVLGNSGGLLMIQYVDTVAIKGLFYFQGVNAAGKIVNISNGYFNIPL